MPARYKKAEVNGKTVNLHRHLMEKHLGRKLTKAELVHHKNEDPFDNDLDNLEVMSHQGHSELHNQKHPKQKKCVVCGETFTPHPTKRAIKKTCSNACDRENRSKNAKKQMAAGQAPGAKLSEEQVRSIREEHARGGTSLRALGRRYSVNHRVIGDIVTRKSWKHVR